MEIASSLNRAIILHGIESLFPHSWKRVRVVALLTIHFTAPLRRSHQAPERNPNVSVYFYQRSTGRIFLQDLLNSNLQLVRPSNKITTQSGNK